MGFVILVFAFGLILFGAYRHQEGDQRGGMFLVVIGFVVLSVTMLLHHNPQPPEGEERYTPAAW